MEQRRKENIYSNFAVINRRRNKSRHDATSHELYSSKPPRYRYSSIYKSSWNTKTSVKLSAYVSRAPTTFVAWASFEVTASIKFHAWLDGKNYIRKGFSKFAPSLLKGIRENKMAASFVGLWFRKWISVLIGLLLNAAERERNMITITI